VNETHDSMQAVLTMDSDSDAELGKLVISRV